MSNEQDDRWYVQFDSQEVRLMTLDELDEAFQKGLVHDETYVIPVGGSDWQTLGEILGGGDEEPEPALTAAPASALAPAFAAPAPFAAAAAPAPFAAAPPSARPQVSAPSAWPPISVAPSQAPVNSSIQSVVPVVQDVVSAADDLDLAQFKPKKTKLALVGAVAVAVIGGLGVAISRLDTPPNAHVAAPAAAPTVEPPTASRKEASFTSTPTPAPSPAPVAAAAPSEEKKDDSTSGTSSSKLSEDMKKALLAQDQERAEKKKSRGKASATTRRASSSSKGGSTPFKASGSAHDPLNGKL